jgi:3-oxoacyl-[acyl-carrier protein] reductase
MNLDLTNKTALVCGASQGLGAAVANELALLGANVFVLARNEEKLKQVVQFLDISLRQQHGYIVADTSHPDELAVKLAPLLAGGRQVHILVNNTGGPATGPLLATHAQDIEAAFRAQLTASHILAQLLVPGMKEAGYGRIVNITSTSVKQPIQGLGISNTVRAAVANWAKTLANELGQFGITVNNVLPGSTRTDRLNYLFEKQASHSNSTPDAIMEKAVAQIPAGRLGEPEELAAVVAFLCAPAAAYINGINLPVDGGKLGGL